MIDFWHPTGRPAPDPDLTHSAQLAGAVQRSAFCTLNRSRWAREFYDAQRGRGRTHHAALRRLGNRWLECWHCLRKSVRCDEAVHVANRNRALGKTA